MFLEVSYLGTPIRVYSFTGAVVENSKQRELHITGSGGGGGMYHGSGAVAPVDISSTTTVHDQVFLVDEHGKENVINLQNWHLSVRTSHTLQTIWAIPGKKQSGPYVAIKNQNLNNIDWADNQLKKVVSTCLYKHVIIGIIFFLCLSFVMKSSFLLIGSISIYTYFIIRRNIFAKDLKKKIESYL